MNKTRKIQFYVAGFTLVEIMIAILAIMITVLGVSGFRYQAALDTRKADTHILAYRTGLMLCEGWSGANGSLSFDPASDFTPMLTICSSGSGPEAPSGFTALGSYKIVINNLIYYATLSWQELSTGLRSLNVIVCWDQRGESDAYADADKTCNLTTYTIY